MNNALQESQSKNTRLRRTVIPKQVNKRPTGRDPKIKVCNLPPSLLIVEMFRSYSLIFVSPLELCPDSCAEEGTPE